MKKIQLKAKILAQSNIKDNYWHCELSAPQVAKNALPGQFINIRVSDNLDPLLRRPISVHGASGTKIKILYEVVGKATAILSQKKTGEFLDILGPLGSGFNCPEPGAWNPTSILVAGGMGVAPLNFLAEKLVKSTIHHPSSTIKVLIGARTKKGLLCVNDFKKLGCQVKIATDDGSSGFKGRVSDLLKHLLSTIHHPPSTIYACGPELMLKSVTDISNKCGIPAQLSLEEHMSCGIGACLGCVIKVKSKKSKVKNGFEYKSVCKEGPVFLAKDLIW